MPTRFIHSMSLRMPSLVMLPFIQCHQTRGRALLGGSAKPLASGSAGSAVADWRLAAASNAPAATRARLDRVLILPSAPRAPRPLSPSVREPSLQCFGNGRHAGQVGVIRYNAL